MAILIDFNDRRARAGVPPRLPGVEKKARTADLLYYTGVRYERIADTDERLDLSDRLDGAPRGSRGKGKRRA